MGNKQTHQYDMYYTQMTIDPYKVMGIAKNEEFTWEDLKNAYRRISIQVHPDKGGSAELFSTVTDCFRTLALELKARESNINHHQRKSQSQEYYSREAEQVERFRQASLSTEKGGTERVDNDYGKGEDDNGDNGEEADFNTKFNKVFLEAKVEDEGHDFGYGEIMAKSSEKREDFTIDRRLDKFSNEAFNKTFDAVVQPTKSDVIIYKEPEALPMCKKLQYVELGADKPSDYTRSEDADTHSLKYTDYKLAHTTERLVDPRTIKTRKEYKNIEDYQNARDKHVKKSQTKEEVEYLRAKQENEALAEEARLKRLASYDVKIGQKYDLASNRLSYIRR